MGRNSGDDPGTGLGRRRAVLAIGIDNLGVLEELFGEELGDEVLAALGRRLARAMPFGADLCATRHRRFLVDLRGLGAASVAVLFERLQAAAAEPIETGSGPVAVTLSGGSAFAEGAAEGLPGEAHALGGCDPVERAALQALHGAMARGVGSYGIALDEGALLECPARLTDATRAAGGAPGTDGAEHLAIVFQPVVRAGGSHTISFHECLARIRRPAGALMTAGGFMPALDRLGMAPLIDRQVLSAALDTLARFPAARLSVNVFPQTMQDPGWMELFDRVATRDAARVERLIVEIAETGAVLNPRRTLAFMDRLRRHGVAFALDDFGAGRTALHHLRDFRFDVAKIDGRFVRDIRPGSDGAFFVEGLVEMARRFDMMSVAEAVQGPAEARCLSGIGVEYFQGFWFGSPSLVLEPTPSPMPAVAAQA